MAAEAILAMGPGYAPFIHTGSSNSARTAGRRGVRQTHPDTFGLWAVQSGILRVEEGEDVRGLRGPAAIFVTPHPDRVVAVTPASEWYFLRFDVVDRSRRRVAVGRRRAWCHAGPVSQPTPREIWGLDLPLVVPPALVSAAIQLLRDACAIWWQDDLGHVQANGSLGHWLADYATACRELRDRQEEGALVTKCRALVRERLHQGIGVADLASACGYGTTRFSERFRAEARVQPGVFIREERLRLAARLLAGEEHSVAAVAARCGYHSRAAFDRAFARRYRRTPAAWRRTQR